MLFRIVLVTMAAFTVLPVNAEETDVENKQSFDLASNPDVLYQPWPGPGAAERQDIVPPPPPGPYMSSALSGLNKGFSGESTSNTDVKAASAQQSPLMRPNTPWPVTGEQPKIWSPEKGVAFAPENNQPAAINQMQAPRMHHRANDFAHMNRPPQNNFVPPQMNQQQMQQRMQEQMKQRQEQQKKMQEQMQARQKQQQATQGQTRQPQIRPPQMQQRMQEQQKKMQELMKQRQEQQKKMQEQMQARQKQQQATQGQTRQPQVRPPQMQQRMQEQQKKMQELMKQRQKQQQEMQEQMRQRHVRPPQMQQMNRHQPVWKNFDIPMSNYPGPQQRARQPLPR